MDSSTPYASMLAVSVRKAEVSKTTRLVEGTSFGERGGNSFCIQADFTCSIPTASHLVPGKILLISLL